MEAFLKTALSLFFRATAVFSTKLAAELAWSFFCKPLYHKKPLGKKEQTLLNQATQYFIDYEDKKIAVYQWQNVNGTQDTKTIMLSHGWGGHAFNFVFIIQSLLEQGFNILAYDSPAHGNSSGKQTNLLQNAQTILEISKKVTPIHALIGHSFGSISSAFALDLAQGTEQLKQVNSIVLIAGPNKLADIFASFTQTMHLPDRILEIFYRKVEALTLRKMQHMNTVNFLQHFSGSILVVHDQNDRVVPFSEAENVSHSSGGKLYSTKGYGHGRILRNEDVVAEIVNSLQN
ncbi:MAG: alpha/beta hydrolase [Pseudomonadota bacterium]